MQVYLHANFCNKYSQPSLSVEVESMDMGNNCGTFALMGFGILGESGSNPPRILRDNCTDKYCIMFVKPKKKRRGTHGSALGELTR